MRLVIDNNVFISARIWDGIPNVVFNRIINGLDTLLVSYDIIDEVETVLRRPKFDAYRERAESAIREINTFGKKIDIPTELSVADSGCRDPKDICYLKCAVAGGADYIVSGDMDLRDLKEYRGIKIVNPREYLEIVGCPAV